MTTQRPVAERYVQPRRYPSPNIPMSAIKRFVRRIAEKFHPEKIILFGSYAYGTPHSESDVDLLVVMRTRNVTDQSIRICNSFEDYPFALDLIVRTPWQLKIGLREGDCNWFLKEILKALLQDMGAVVPKIHDLVALLELLLPHDGTLEQLRRSLSSLTRYAVDYRYPDRRASTRQMQSALRNAERVRMELEGRLGNAKGSDEI